ncbi:MAG: hypothetical protein VX733_04065 [Candidatus Latescibacterota bacterium]|nr:hypothetical protein [Candidatus Latescibacterota bacterium]
MRESKLVGVGRSFSLEAALVNSYPIYMICTLFWFDVEDYLTPSSDDALKSLLEIFETNGVQATWKVVAEKARVLEERERTDVIRLLQRQDIGYHTENHSQHPVLAEYLQHAGWEDGIEEVNRHERQGYEDVTRILGPSSTFGQAGGSWAPQIYPFMREVGIPLFMDEAPQIGFDAEPFWYCGVPHVNRMRENCTRMNFKEGPEGLVKGIRDFDKIHERLSGDGGGLISIFYHPCEWSTTDFWDGVNFADGAMPPAAEWKPAPERSAKDFEEGLSLFGGYLQHIQNQVEVEIITGRQLVNMLPDYAQGRSFRLDELLPALELTGGKISHYWHGDLTLAPSELFSLAVEGALKAFLAVTEGRDPAKVEVTLEATPYGPTRRIESAIPEGEEISTQALMESTSDVRQFLQYHGRMPDAAWLGARAIAPGDFLLTLAGLARQLLASKSVDTASTYLPMTVPFLTGRLTSEEHVNADAWKWRIFSREFNPVAITELARLQAWTLKPATFIG